MNIIYNKSNTRKKNIYKINIMEDSKKEEIKRMVNEIVTNKYKDTNIVINIVENDVTQALGEHIYDMRNDLYDLEVKLLLANNQIEYLKQISH
jgi:hypothetical protein